MPKAKKPYLRRYYISVSVEGRFKLFGWSWENEPALDETKCRSIHGPYLDLQEGLDALNEFTWRNPSGKIIA